MKVALLSDVHGNLPALEAVLESVARESPDVLLSLGDVAATGPQPHEVVQSLKRHRAVCIMGNTDESLLRPEPRSGAGRDLATILEADEWCTGQLTRDDRSFMRTFRRTLRLDLSAGRSLLAFHGSPRSASEWIPSTVDDERLSRVFGRARATVFAGGHSHRQLLLRWRDSLLVNPGSVGMPFQRLRGRGPVAIPPWSEFAVLACGVSLDVSFRRVPYDRKSYEEALASSGMPVARRLLPAWRRHMGSLLDSGQIA